MDAPRPLLVTHDPELLDDLLRLAAAAAIETTVAHTPAHASRDWSRAPLVVVGADLATALAELDLDPHPNLVVASRFPAGAAEPTHTTADTAVRLHVRTPIALPDDEDALADLFADSARPGTRGSLAISVIGGRGGAGASVLAVALAMAGRRAKLDAALVDADPLGSGLDLMMGEDHALGVRWDDLASREGRMSWPALRETLPRPEGVALLVWNRGAVPHVPVPAMRAVLSSAVRGADLTVIDLPRALDPGAEEALRRSRSTLLAVPADLHSVLAAQRMVAHLREHAADPRVVVRGGTSRFPAESVTNALELPLAGEIPSSRGVLNALDKGTPPGRRRGSPLARFADRFVSGLRDDLARPSR